MTVYISRDKDAYLKHYGVKGMKWKHHKSIAEIDDAISDNDEIIRETSDTWKYSKSGKGKTPQGYSRSQTNKWAISDARLRRQAIEANAKLKKQKNAMQYMPTKGASGTSVAKKSLKRGDLVSKGKKTISTFLKRYFSPGGSL